MASTVSGASLAAAEEPVPVDPIAAAAADPRVELTKKERRLLEEPSGYAHTFATLAVGTGLRFSNPYRLSNVLGETSESLSLTAPYLDLGGNLLFGDPEGLQHGGALHLGTSLSGVTQPFLSASYLLAYGGLGPFLPYGRVGPSILFAPDVNVGAEIAGGAAVFFAGALGITSELVFDLYYGAATLDSSYSAIPVLSFQIGLVVDYEVLP